MPVSGTAWCKNRCVRPDVFHVSLRSRTIPYQLSFAPLPQRYSDSVTENRDSDGQKRNDKESAVFLPPIQWVSSGWATRRRRREALPFPCFDRMGRSILLRTVFHLAGVHVADHGRAISARRVRGALIISISATGCFHPDIDPSFSSTIRTGFATPSPSIRGPLHKLARTETHHLLRARWRTFVLRVIEGRALVRACGQASGFVEDQELRLNKSRCEKEQKQFKSSHGWLNWVFIPRYGSGGTARNGRRGRGEREKGVTMNIRELQTQAVLNLLGRVIGDVPGPECGCQK